MLAELSIKNFAIIDDLSVRFSDGLTAITGQTGAGKTIRINAVNLLFDARAAPKMIRTRAKGREPSHTNHKA
ncbi:AAA family ATPase [Desulfatibacillum aliphaticivorans]|uniref:AAA family ATPase n=1 Tax=Desulfatibacillum aliphaticivorans TaxID=218208 RepID=UPI0003F4CFB3|nr:AAA family ATPase [Desulfatibacillum aliphaticivorans]